MTYDVTRFNGLGDLHGAVESLDSNYGWLSPGRSDVELLNAKMDDVVDALRAIRDILAEDE